MFFELFIILYSVLYFFMEYAKTDTIIKFIKNNFSLFCLIYIGNFSIIAISRIQLNLFSFLLVFSISFLFYLLSILQYIKSDKQNSYLFKILSIIIFFFLIDYLIGYLIFNKLLSYPNRTYHYFKIILAFILSMVFIILLITYIVFNAKFYLDNYKQTLILLLFAVPFLFSVPIIKYYKTLYLQFYQKKVIAYYDRAKEKVEYDNNVVLFWTDDYVGYIYKQDEEILNAEFVLKYNDIEGIKWTKASKKLKTKTLCIENKKEDKVKKTSVIWLKKDYMHDEIINSVIINYLNKGMCPV
ncbi:MAG: hypothetical protein Ta2D_08270 [Rickettsiales bacterium]|nr:MAG: hypothetical protein Ta2D_08270 [Rickettsiales bacterium]